MSDTERRLAEIYSYYLEERYLDDLSDSFTEWLSTSMYGDEVAEAAVKCLATYKREAQS